MPGTQLRIAGFSREPENLELWRAHADGKSVICSKQTVFLLCSSSFSNITFNQQSPVFLILLLLMFTFLYHFSRLFISPTDSHVMLCCFSMVIAV